MKKILLSGAAIAVIATLSAPQIISSNIQQQTQKYIDNINALPLYRAEIVESNFGWLTSQAKVKLALDFSEALAGQPNIPDMEPLELLVDLDVKHGPILSSGLNLSEFSVAINGEKYKDTLSWDSTKALYKLNAKVDAFGSISYVDESPEISYANAEGIELYLEAYKGEAKTVDGVLIHSGVLPSVTVNTQQFSMAIENIVMSTELFQPLGSYFGYDSVPVYNAKVDFENWQILSLNNQPIIDLNNFSLAMKSGLNEEQHTASGEIAYRLESFNAMGYQGEDLELVLEMNNLDEQSYIQLNKLFVSNSVPTDPEKPFEHLLTFLQDNLLAILKPQPELNITSLKGSLPEGKFNAHLNAKIENVTKAPADLKELGFWLGHLNADSKIEIAKPLMSMIASQIIMTQITNHPSMAQATPQEIQQAVEQQVPGFIGMLEAQGTLVADGENYLVNFELENKQAKLNGNAIPLPL